MALVTKSSPHRSMIQAVLLALILVALVELFLSGIVFVLQWFAGA